MKDLSRCPVTFLIILTALSVHLALGPATDPREFRTLPDLILGVMRHGDALHLLVNCALVLIGGYISEPRLGSLQFVCLAALCAVTGVVGELVLAGPGFVGLSGVAYGLISYAVIVTSSPDRRDLNALLIALALAAELALLRSELAVFTHISAAICGGGIAMFGSLFGTKGPHLKQMEWKHVSRVVEIINQTDEDDAIEAEATFIDGGYENMFVLIDRGEVLGLTGFGVDDQVADLAWLSWTYLDEAAMGQGLGAQMLNELLGGLAKQGVRKIFIETSDYEENGRKIYENAHRLYEEFGANLELTLPDYHSPGEAKLIYGIDNPDAPKTEPLDADGNTGLRITGLQKAPETQDVAGLMWEEAPVGLAGTDHYLGQIAEQGFRIGLLAIPGDLSDANAEQLNSAGLTKIGSLKDYYGSGQSQDWWRTAENQTPS
jgi:membrane associated rhomboid family serine protease/ribosomal protein S18 acetylase RimI-like enzyme